MTADEAEERLQAGWNVEASTLELIESDYDSPQRKRWMYQLRRDRLHSLMKAQRERR